MRTAVVWALRRNVARVVLVVAFLALLRPLIVLWEDRFVTPLLLVAGAAGFHHFPISTQIEPPANWGGVPVAVGVALVAFVIGALIFKSRPAGKTAVRTEGPPDPLVARAVTSEYRSRR